MLDIEASVLNKYPQLRKSKLAKKTLNKFVESFIHQKEINRFVETHKHLGSYEFIDEVLDYFHFGFSANEQEIENIPSSGRVVIIANHPLGALDALSLIKLISKVRKDIKVIANDFLSIFENLTPLLLQVDVFGKQQTKESIKKIYESLESESALIIFPSGEVSRATPSGIKDQKWHKGFLKFASRTNSPILPILIEGKNSRTFYSISAMNKKLSTALLPNEMFKQKNKSIHMHIGELIPSENILPKGIQEDKLVTLYKKHLYGLKKNKCYFQTQKAIAHPLNPKDIKKELKHSQLLGKTKDGKYIYLYNSSDKNSVVINEIGRLRELSFRKVAEGINKKRDIDKYDRYYKHIVLWDNEELEIVGAYRIAEVKEILNNRGMDALYTTTLFQYKKDFFPYLSHSIELGRSFVQPKYWGSHALDYLWQGIGAYLKNNPHIHYMYGPLSLSQSYPKVAKDMILYFYNLYFQDTQHRVTALLPYKIDTDDEYMQQFIKELDTQDYSKDFKLLKRALGYLELSVPTLYKQYTNLCETGGIKFCAYNIDTNFSNCIDSFIVVDIRKIKPKQKKRYFGA